MFADLAAKNRAALVPYLLEGVAGDPIIEFARRHSSKCSRPKNSCRKRLARARTGGARSGKTVARAALWDSQRSLERKIATIRGVLSVKASGYNGRRPLHGVDALDKETKKNTMDPARPMIRSSRSVFSGTRRPSCCGNDRDRHGRLKIAVNACANCDRC